MRFENWHFEEIDSTNTQATKAVARGEIEHPTVVWASKQTAGRGTRGRVWQSATGNVHASYVFPLNANDREAHLFVYSIALAVRDTIASYLEEVTVEIKWPNDILVNGAKISGSLHELAYHKTEPFFVAGIGINNKWKPESDVMYSTACISDFVDEIPKVQEIVQNLGQKIGYRIEEFKRDGFQNQMSEYLRYAFRLGKEIEVKPRGEAANVYKGIFEGIETDGKLVLKSGNERLTFVAADIFPGL